MARKSKVERDKKIELTIQKYDSQRRELLNQWNDSSLSFQKRREARRALGKLPRNANPNRLTNRCSITGRPRGYIRFVGLSRIVFRDKALLVEFPGIRKASL